MNKFIYMIYHNLEYVYKNETLNGSLTISGNCFVLTNMVIILISYYNKPSFVENPTKK